MGLGPVHDALEFAPIIDIFERHMFNRCTGDDQTIEFLVSDLFKGAVEAFHVFGGRMPGLMIGHAQQGQFNLQRCRADEAGELILRLDFLGHQVQQGDAQRAKVLSGCQLLVQHHDPFVAQNVKGGQAGGDLDGHETGLSGVASAVR